MRRTLLLLALPLPLCAGALIGLSMFSALLRPEPFAASGTAEVAFEPRPGGRLPLTAALIDERGRSVVLGDYFARVPVIVVLDYLRCTSLCGVTLRNLVLDGLNPLPLELGRDYQLITISIDPRDAPTDAAAAQTKYATLLTRRQPGNSMHFLTGSAAATREIADAVGFRYRYDAVLDAYIHPAGFIIASPRGVISRYVEGVASSPPELVSAIADAEEDKSQGPLTRLLLLCHVQGTRLGRFTVPLLAAFTIADLSAAISLIALFNFLRRRRSG